VVLKKWFTLYWIPIVPLGEIGRAVVCCICQSQFREEILGLASTAPGTGKNPFSSGVDWKDWRQRAFLGVLLILVVVGLLQVGSEDRPQPTLDGVQQGRKLYKEGRLVEATEKMSQVLHRNPDQPSVYMERGITYLSRKEYVRALADFDEAIRRKPDFGEAYLMRSLSYDAIGAQAKAEEDRERAASFGVREVRY
jgi:tetratricopeptide (TPR) repeat protein